MENLLKDIRYEARMLFKRPGFTSIAVLTLALGIGANTAIFSVVNAVLFRPLPYTEPERIVQCYWKWASHENITVTATQFAFWKEHSTSFEEAAGYDGASFNLAGGIEPLRVRGLRVSDGFLRVLRVSPAWGRDISAEENIPNAPTVAVISDGLWRRYFAADPAVIGREILLNGRSCSVVGVLPQGFQFEATVDLLVPLQLKADPRDQGHNTTMIARLKPGVPLQQAQAEMDQLLPQFVSEFPKHIGPTERGILLVSYQQHVVGDISKVLLLLFGAVGFVLLIACANVANLLLARSAARANEMAIRVALGAGRSRLIRQLMTENMLLALIGGVAGLFVAMWCVPALLALSPQALPRLGEVNLDQQAALFAIGASVVTSLLFGIAPAFRATRIDINESLKASSSRAGASRLDTRLRGLLVVSEVALSLVLLVGAALLIKSFAKLNSVELGFDPNNLTTMQASLTSEKYKSAAQVWSFQQQVLERISALPGVVSAATVPSLPMERGLNSVIVIEGGKEQIQQSIECRAISPDYFRTLGISLLRGRAVTDSDTRESAQVAVINEKLARRYWPDSDPIGQEVQIAGARRQIVGIVSDIREMGLDRPVGLTIYVHRPQMPDGLALAMNRWFLSSWIVRTEGAVDLSKEMRNIVSDLDPQMPIANIRPMTSVIGNSISSQQFLMLLMGSFAALALILTAVGIYGVLSYQVSRRTHEIGIRMALGASQRDVLKLVVGQGLLLALAGVAIGLAASLALTRLMESLLFGVSATDPVTFAVTSLILTGVALAACFVPARRATKVDPTVALRYE